MTPTKPVLKWCARASDGTLWTWTMAEMQRDVRNAAEATFVPSQPWTHLRRRYGLTIVRVEIREIG